MNRKQFLQILVPAGLSTMLLKTGVAQNSRVHRTGLPPVPPYLQPGDTIGITCPANPLEIIDATNCIRALESCGYKVKIGRTIGKNWQRFSGTDEERASDLQDFLDDETIAAVLFGRGGYGLMRIMDRINWDKFILKPKWLVGFSDITAIHCLLNTVYQIPTLHADMANGFNGTRDEAEQSLLDALSGKKINYSFPGFRYNRCGQVTGELVGGNLSLIYAMQASNSQLETDGKILFIEDVSEYKYTIDRMLMNLKRSGKLDNLAALAVGSFTSIKDEKENKFPMPLEEIIYEKVREYHYPVCFYVPAGHQRWNLALKLGIKYQLTVGNGFCNLTELPNLELKPIPVLPSGE